MLYEEYGYIGVMIDYLERILQTIADFFQRLMGGSPSAIAPETTAAATTEAAPSNVIIY